MAGLLLRWPWIARRDAEGAKNTDDYSYRFPPFQYHNLFINRKERKKRKGTQGSGKRKLITRISNARDASRLKGKDGVVCYKEGK